MFQKLEAIRFDQVDHVVTRLLVWTLLSFCCFFVFRGIMMENDLHQTIIEVNADRVDTIRLLATTNGFMNEGRKLIKDQAKQIPLMQTEVIKLSAQMRTNLEGVETSRATLTTSTNTAIGNVAELAGEGKKSMVKVTETLGVVKGVADKAKEIVSSEDVTDSFHNFALFTFAANRVTNDFDTTVKHLDTNLNGDEKNPGILINFNKVIPNVNNLTKHLDGMAANGEKISARFATPQSFLKSVGQGALGLVMDVHSLLWAQKVKVVNKKLAVTGAIN